MNTRPTLLVLTLLSTLPFATLPTVVEAKAIALAEQEIEVFESGEKVTVELNGQTLEGEEARKHAQLARAHADKMREEIRARLPDTAGVAEAISNSVAYSFTTGNVKPIKNAPYAGEVLNERIQTLADGNQLVNKRSNRVFRDSQGATRQEVLDANGQMKTVHIRDTDGTRFVLMPAKKSALKIGTPKTLADGKPGTWTSKGGKDGETIAKSTENIVVKRINVDGKEKREEIRVLHSPGFPSSGNSGLTALGELGKLGDLSDLSEHSVMSDAFHAAGDAFSMAWRHGEPEFVKMDNSYERTTTSLGSKSFDGVIAEGKMVSYTIPAGKVGNAKPITVSSETWYSQDLQITVYSKHSDPRSGDVIYRVANLKRGEQPTDLFRVPADYDVKDPLAKLSGAVKIERVEKK